MYVIWYRPAKVLIQRNLSYRWLDEIGAADDFADPLKMVVNHYRQVIGEQPIATMDDEIFPRQRLVGDQRAAQAVGELQNRTGLAQAQRGVFGAKAQIATVTVVDPADAVNARAGAGAVVAEIPIAQKKQKIWKQELLSYLAERLEGKK